ncbi:MAG: M20/M25/M40 family metallo-hydrolase [Steroidobacteraceae bacterium]
MNIPCLKSKISALLLSVVVGAPLCAQSIEPVDWDVVSRIRAESFNRSQVSELLKELTETVGPRLTASPSAVKANEWARGKLGSWGLANVHDEVWDPAFGRGWAFRSATLEWLSPRALPLHALPRAWTPGTSGPVEGEVELLVIKTFEDLQKRKGQLRGKILLLDEARKYERPTTPDFVRHSEASLGELQTFPIAEDPSPEERSKRREDARKRDELTKLVNPFLVEEGVVATLHISAWDNGILRVTGGGSRKAGESSGVPDLVVAAEHYNQLVRAVQRKDAVRLRVNVDGGFTSEQDLPAANTFGEIPGSGPKSEEVVIIGAHMDSWHTGTGASDNGAGTVVMMEALRILKKIGVKPRRTIRVALWTGEEQGLLGSTGYVDSHFAAWPEPTDPKEKALPRAVRELKGPLQRKAAYDKLAAYFNFDNGSGRIRGVYAQENAAVVPIFEAWLKPFEDLDARIVTLRNTSSTDHISFDRVGLPGFQFVQDPADYRTHVHHTSLDTWDHILPEDLKQAAAVIASFAYHAAMREQRLPRKPLIED